MTTGHGEESPLHSLASAVLNCHVRVVEALDESVANTVLHPFQLRKPVAGRQIGFCVVKVKARRCERVLHVVDNAPLDRVDVYSNHRIPRLPPCPR